MSCLKTRLPIVKNHFLLKRKQHFSEFAVEKIVCQLLWMSSILMILKIQLAFFYYY